MRHKLALLLVLCLAAAALLGIGAPPAAALADQFFQVMAPPLPWHSPIVYVNLVEGVQWGLALDPFEGEDGGVWSDFPVYCGSSWIAMPRGLAQSIPRAMQQKLTVCDAATGEVIASCDTTNCRQYWGPVFRWNARWSDPMWWHTPYNPKVKAGPWARDWLVPLTGLKAHHWYSVSYSERFTRTVADPLWSEPGSGPPIYKSTGWTDYETFSFWVSAREE